jgi:hypothetical protein
MKGKKNERRWGIGLAFHAFWLFGTNRFFGKDWEERQIKKILEKEKQSWNGEMHEHRQYQRQGRTIMRLSVFFPAGSLALFFVQGEGPLVGLLQRLFVAVISGWIILVAYQVRKIAGSSENETSGDWS